MLINKYSRCQITLLKLASLLQKCQHCIDLIYSSSSHDFSGEVDDNRHDATINSDIDYICLWSSVNARLSAIFFFFFKSFLKYEASLE